MLQKLWNADKRGLFRKGHLHRTA